MITINLASPYLLFLGDTKNPVYAKTAFGIRDWAPDRCVGEWRLPGCEVSAGLPFIDPAEAYRLGARALAIGVAHPGGATQPGWIAAFEEALAAGLDVIGGTHERLVDHPDLRACARVHGRELVDIRKPPAGIPIATGRKRSGRRLLTIGSDCAVGKKYTALAIAQALRAAGVAADFRATGQTGILIAGRGMPIDAVVSDFVAGAAEILSPDADDDHWDIIEGQGSLSHPAYGSVSLGLLLGSQPDVLIACHQPGRERLLGFDRFAVEPIEEMIELALRHARRVNPAVLCGGVSLNTSHLSEPEALILCRDYADRLGIPCADPMRRSSGFDHLVSTCFERSLSCHALY